MLYEIIVNNHGVPSETWEAEADSPEQACEDCQAERTATGAHSRFDSYDAVPPPESHDEQLAHDDALVLAYRDACRHMPALAERGSMWLFGYDLNEPAAVGGIA